MKKALFILSLVLLILVACNPKDDNGGNSITNKKDIENVKNNPEFNFSAKLVNSQWQASKGFYENANNSVIISAISDNYERLFLIIDNSEKGTYQLDNRSYYTNDNGTFYVTDGKVELAESKDNFLNGSFSFNAVNSVDSSKLSVTDGKFSQVAAENLYVEANKAIQTTKLMDLNADKGSIEDKDANVEILFQDKVILFKNKDVPTESFSVKYSSSEEKGSGAVYISADANIEYVFVDGLKNQVTIFYKNGNSKTYH